MDLIEELLNSVCVHGDYHFGGYAKVTDELIDFIDDCEKKYQLPLDKVYTSKAFYGLMQEIKQPTYDHSTIVFLHTGGLFLSH